LKKQEYKYLTTARETAKEYKCMNFATETASKIQVSDYNRNCGAEYK